MKRRDLVAKLNEMGWFPVRQGKHEIFGHVAEERTIPVPRHVEINKFTAAQILRDAAL